MPSLIYNSEVRTSDNLCKNSRKKIYWSTPWSTKYSFTEEMTLNIILSIIMVVQQAMQMAFVYWKKAKMSLPWLLIGLIETKKKYPAKYLGNDDKIKNCT